MRIEILPVLGIGEVTEGDDLAVLISVAAPWLRDGDVLVVTSKIVSKAEGQLVDVPTDGPEREAAREAVLAAETARPVAQRGATRIVRTHHGFVMASAGIDASNVDPGRLVLLPKDPDASARALRAGLRERHGVDVAVIISDTMGRPWRNGLTDVALGVAGMDPIRDHRGEVDAHGNELHITQMAVADELAGAGELVKGKCDGVPVAVIRGWLRATAPDDPAGASVLVRDPRQDLFWLGTAEARTEGLRAAATLGDTLPSGVGESALVGSPVGPAGADPAPAGDSTAPAGPGQADPAPAGDSTAPAGPGQADPAAVTRAIAVVAGAVAPGTVFTEVTDAQVRDRLADAVPGWPAATSGMIRCTPPAVPPSGSAAGAESADRATDPAALIRFGADVHRLRSALAAEGVPSTVHTATEPAVAGGAPVLLLAV